MNKENIVCIWLYKMECYSTTKTNEIVSFVSTWIELKDTVLTKKSGTETQIVSVLTYIWKLNTDIN